MEKKKKAIPQLHLWLRVVCLPPLARDDNICEHIWHVGEAPLCKSNKHNDNRDGGRRTKIIRWLETGQYILCAVTIRMLHVDECNSVDLSELAAQVCVCVCVSLKSDNKSYWIKDASRCCLMSHSCGEKTNVNLQIKVRLGSRYRSASALRLRANSGGWQSIQSGRLLLPLFY